MTRLGLPDGLWVALPTPFTVDEGVDLPALRAIVRHVVDGGVDVLVPLGTTGEAATLDELERDAVIATCLEEAAGRPVVVGCGSPSTRVATAYVRRARALGAAGALVVTPYYNKPTQEGLLAHYAALATAAPGFPLVAYNVPSRTGVSLALPTLDRLWQVESVVALKESSGDVDRAREIARALPPGKSLLCGDDALVAAMVEVGAHGLVSVAANVAPSEVAMLCSAARAGDAARVREGMHALAPLFAALFRESNPIPLKAALARLRLSTPRVRLPLTPASPATAAAIADALVHCGRMPAATA